MPKPKASLGLQWMSPTDIRATLTKIHANRIAHGNLLRNLSQKLADHRESFTASLRGLDAKDRPSIVNKSVSGMRGELARESADQRLAHTRELKGLVDRMKSATSLYASPVQMLMRDTIGSEARSRYMQQIASSGPVELAALAEYAAATRNKDLAAALCSRVADLPRAERPFLAGELADTLFGELHRELAQALTESERHLLETLNEEANFETGRKNEQRTIEIAMLKKRERQINAYDRGLLDGDEDQDDVESADPTDRIAAGLEARRSMDTAAAE